MNEKPHEKPKEKRERPEGTGEGGQLPTLPFAPCVCEARGSHKPNEKPPDKNAGREIGM
jgi:hypothetical protein